MNEIRTAPERLFWLDGIKGISCLCVFLHHFCLRYFPATFYGLEAASMANGVDLFLASSPLGLLINGNFFVHLYILISGYVISYQVIKLRSEDFGYFMLKRYLKLLIPLFVFFAFWFLLKVIENIGNPDLLKLSIKELYKGIYSLFLGILFKGDIYLGSHFWMMNYIFLGGVIVGILSSLCWKYDSKKVMFLSLFCGVLVFILFISQLSLHYATIFFGCALCLFNKNYDLKLNKYVSILLFIIGLIFAAFPTYLVPENFYRFFLLPFDKHNAFSKYFWHSFSAVLIIFSVSKSEWLKKIFSNRLFQEFSKISFWVFIFHGIIISIIDKLLFAKLESDLNYLTLVLILFVVDLVLVILVTVLLYLFISPLCNKITKYLLSKVCVSKESN